MRKVIVGAMVSMDGVMQAPGGPDEDPMSKFIRQSHRWLSIALTLTVIANFMALAVLKGQQPPPVVTYSPLLPLFLLMFSGLYLFALPYTAKGRSTKGC